MASPRTPLAASADTGTPTPAVPATGRIDIHSHLLPGVDDGCADLDESLQCIAQLKARGYVGSICTPHAWPGAFPIDATPAVVARWVEQLQRELAERGIEYALWPGAEVRIFDDAIPWMTGHGVPTLANSRCVLFDSWGQTWDPNIFTIFQWLLERDYQPILAHPERMNYGDELEPGIRRLLDMGVLLQGNLRSFSGDNGYQAQNLIRQWLEQNRFALLALDTHRPDSLPPRFVGLDLAIEEYGRDRIDPFLTTAPRRLIFNTA